ncbi:hypothetical protein N9878_01325 [bacterium]|nr:hypothetical protein [bacterium]
MKLRHLCLAFILTICPPQMWAAEQDLSDLFQAIGQVESGHDDDAVGDGGASIGRYQIQRAYWIDSGVPGNYEQVRDKAYAERVMRAYWKRYTPQALRDGDYETLSRAHVGGPKGPQRKSSLPYWRKVEAELKKGK